MLFLISIYLTEHHARETLRYISGLLLSLLVDGNTIPANLQWIGMFDSSNLKDETSVERTTSATQARPADQQECTPEG